MLKKMLAILTIIAVPALSQATIAPTWVDYMDFEDQKLNMWNGSYTYSHDLTDDGFDVGLDTALSGLLVIGVKDDGGFFDGGEVVKIDIAGLVFDEYEAVNFNYEAANIGFKGLIEVNSTGMLEISISALIGDFWLTDSTLKAWGHDHDVNGTPGASVPEPGTLMLLSLSLLGIAGARRFKKSA